MVTSDAIPETTASSSVIMTTETVILTDSYSTTDSVDEAITTTAGLTTSDDMITDEEIILVPSSSETTLTYDDETTTLNDMDLSGEDLFTINTKSGEHDPPITFTQAVDSPLTTNEASTALESTTANGSHDTIGPDVTPINDVSDHGITMLSYTAAATTVPMELEDITESSGEADSIFTTDAVTSTAHDDVTLTPEMSQTTEEPLGST